MILTRRISQIIPASCPVQIGLDGTAPVKTPHSVRAALPEKNNKLHVNK